MKELFGIYVHWPFCEKKCPYCDFNSYVSNSQIQNNLWYNAFAKQIDYFLELTSKKTVTSIFFGGGTPSLMHPNLIKKIINKITNSWQCDNNIEITLEANPCSINEAKIKHFNNAGINRLSLGIQSTKNENLLFLGRQHNAEQSINIIKQVGEVFDNFSFDLIYGLPKQTQDCWEKRTR